MSERSEKRKIEAEEVALILEAVSERVPKLIKSLVLSVFSEESAASIGKAVSAYYKELKAGGIPDDVALKMTQDYVGIFSKMGKFMARGREHEGDEDVGKELKKAILAKVKKELEEEKE